MNGRLPEGDSPRGWIFGAAVDAQTRAELQDLLLDLAARYRQTCLFVTHDVDEAVYVADRVLVLARRPTLIVADLTVPLAKPRDQIETRWPSRLAAALAVVLALAAVPPPAVAQQTLRLAYLRTLEIIPVVDAEQMGYLKAERLKIDRITLNNGPAAVAAVVSGSADIGYAANLPVISAVAEHQPVRAFVTQSSERWPGQGWEYLLASARSGVKTLAGLEGKTAASNATNGGCDLAIRDHLRAAGIPAAAVHMAVVPFPQMKAALQFGTVDAEMLAGQSGLGFLLYDAGFSLRTADMFAIMAMVGVLGLLFNLLVQQASRLVVGWHLAMTAAAESA